MFEIGTLESRFFKFGRDRSLQEIVETGKFALIIYMLLEMWRNTGERVIRAWMILFSVMLADNLIGIHEEVGELITIYFELPDVGFKREKDLAEIIVFALLEGTALLYVAWSYLQSGEVGRRFSHHLCLIFVPFVFCALILDAIGPQVVEESGEIIGMTLVMGWLHYQFRNKYS